MRCELPHEANISAGASMRAGGRSVPSRSQMVREDRCGVHLQRKLSGEEITTFPFFAFTGSPAALRLATVVDDLVAWTGS